MFVKFFCNLKRTLALTLMLLLLGCFALPHAQANAESENAELKIGALLNLTGFGARWGLNAQRGIILAQEEINARGGVNGHPISVLFEDTRSGDRNACAAAAHKLISIDHVQALLTQWTGDTEVAWPIASRAGVPTVTVSAGAPDFVRNRPLLVRTWGDDRELMSAIVKFLKLHGFKRPTLLVTQDEYFLGIADELKILLANNGMAAASETEVPPDVTDLRSEMLRASKTSTDSVIGLLMYHQQASMLKQLRILHLNLPVFGTIGSDDQSVLDQAGTAANNLIIPTYPYGTQNFFDRFLTRWGEKPWLSADTAYDALAIVAQAAQFGTNGNLLTENIKAIHDFPGASGTVSILPNGERLPRSTKLLIVKNGLIQELQ